MNKRRRTVFAIFMAAALVAAMSIAVYAYLSAQSDSVDNEFGPAPSVAPSIAESVNDPLTEKKNVAVAVGETGYSIYVRAVIVANWIDDNGYVYPSKPVVGTDYSISLNETDWFEKGGFYYHKNPVVSDTSTADLILSCTQAKDGPKGFSLHVEIIAQTIQALGSTDGDDSVPAVTDAWGVTVENGMLKAN